MSQSIVRQAGPAPVATCDPTTRVTRSLLGYGVLAGPVYVLVSVAQAATRDGFDPRRHAWSLLTVGHLGWIQVTNFILAGLMTLAYAAGLHRALAGGWVARLVGGYGLSLVLAGLFRPDPSLGFPPGTPDGPGTVSWHGVLHFACGGVGFACLIAACLLAGRRFARQGSRGWARYSRATGLVFLGGFLCVAAGAGQTWANLVFTATVILAWAWLCALALHLYRTH